MTPTSRVSEKMSFPSLDAKRLSDIARRQSDQSLERLAVELGIEADAETVSFMRQAFMQASIDIQNVIRKELDEYRMGLVSGNDA
jgi:hypothetical protein